ncbi:MAG TPA: hypothetical protein VKV32_03940 [Stellaceae bacterium]|nr:hypothetical protein [Stellaceae bacterium]
MDGHSPDGSGDKQIIQEICDLGWSALDQSGVIDAAWAYYFFSVQFQENLETARALFPDDEKLKELEREESNTDNLSPWPGVAAVGERMNHCEFMRRALALAPLPDAKRKQFEEAGARYLRAVRAMEPLTRALSISSYEDGGLERVFGAMLNSPPFDHPVVGAFRYFLFTHIEFDSDPVKGHGAMARHLRPDDRVLPLWTSFRDILVGFVPALAAERKVAGGWRSASAA